MEKIVKSVDGLGKEAAKIIREAIHKHTENSALVVGLCGDLGAGKTVFVQAIARELGITENVTSPTFVIEKIYKLPSQKHSFLIHIDAYRFGSCEEMNHLGWDSISKDPQNIICVEWADRVLARMPDTTLWITLVHADARTRTLHYGHKK